MTPYWCSRMMGLLTFSGGVSEVIVASANGIEFSRVWLRPEEVISGKIFSPVRDLH